MDLFESLFSILLGRYLQRELLGRMVTLKFDFEELPNSVPQQPPHFKFPAAMDKRSHCSTPLPKLVLVQVFGASHPSGVVSRCGFDLHS